MNLRGPRGAHGLARIRPQNRAPQKVPPGAPST